jgi:hypothetical protein
MTKRQSMGLICFLRVFSGQSKADETKNIQTRSCCSYLKLLLQNVYGCHNQYWTLRNINRLPVT